MDQSGGTLPFQPSVSMPMSDRIVPDKIYSRADLHTFDGANPEQPVMLAINGYVFDVSEGRQFYEPGGPYSSFAGSDATRGLCLFELKPSNDPLDLSTCTKIELESLENWEQFYFSKYKCVGKLEKTEVKKLPEKLPKVTNMSKSTTEKDARPGKRTGSTSCCIL